MALVASLKTPQPRNITMQLSPGALAVDGSLATLKISQDLGARVAELERRLDETQKAVDELEHGLQNEAAERREEIAYEIAAVREEVEKVRQLMENYAAGGLSFDVAEPLGHHARCGKLGALNIVQQGEAGRLRCA